MTEKLPAIVDFSEALVRQIAMDVGKQVAFHIETMYPAMLDVDQRNVRFPIATAVLSHQRHRHFRA